MTQCEFDLDRRYCPQCATYVRYLRSPHRAYCTDCGSVVRLYSADDMERLRTSVRGVPDNDRGRRPRVKPRPGA